MAEFDFRNNRASQPKAQPVAGGDGTRFDLSGGKARPASIPIKDSDIPIPVPQQPAVQTYQDGKYTMLMNAADAVDKHGPMEHDEAFDPPVDITDHAARIARIQAENKVSNVSAPPRPASAESEFQSLDSIRKPGTRTPILPDPAQQTLSKGTSVKVRDLPADDVDVPQPLHIVNNMLHTTPAKSEDLVPFDVNSLPKKQQEMGDAESEDLARLDQAVEREMASISERIRGLTQKQYEELMDARAEGKTVARPMSEEEYEAAEHAQMMATAQQQADGTSTVAQTTSEGVTKRLVVRDEVSPEDKVSINTKADMDKQEAFIKICSESAKYVADKVTATNYFERALHGRNRLMKNGVYAEIWSIVMYNGEGEAIAHPILVAKTNNFTAIVEVNLVNIAGIHMLEANDTIESVYRNFQMTGALYEYIDYLKQAIVVKLPADMPTAEIALQRANARLGANKPMNPNETPNVPAEPVVETATPTVDVPEDAIIQDEATALNAMAAPTMTEKVMTDPPQYEEHEIPGDQVSQEIYKKVSKVLSIDTIAGKPVAHGLWIDGTEFNIEVSIFQDVYGVEPEYYMDKPTPKEDPKPLDYFSMPEITINGDGKSIHATCEDGSIIAMSESEFADAYSMSPEEFMTAVKQNLESRRQVEMHTAQTYGIPHPGEQLGPKDLPPVQYSTSPQDDDDPVTIKREYDGAVMPDGAANIINSDLEKDLESELKVSSRSDDEVLNDLKAAVKQAVPAIRKKISLKDFTISDTPISAAQVAGFSIRDINQADWVMPNAARMISVRGLSGPELFSMNPNNINKNKINTFRQIYGIIYQHVTSKKPPTFDEWLKVTRFSDIDHIYGALLRATFAGSLFLHYECEGCNNVFIQEYKFEDLVHYRDDKAKNRIERILNSADSSIAGYDVELSQISDQYVVGLKDPSIWSMVMETAALSDKFLEKYEDLLDTMSFIDSIYIIDENTHQLRPIDFGYDPKEPAKSTARKITIMSDIIRTLSSDNYFGLRTQIAKTFSSSDDLSYQIPEAVCPKCGHKFEVEPISAMNLLFMRHQLGALGVM